MKFTHRSYSGKLFLPKPIIDDSSDPNLLLISFPWGRTRGAEVGIATFLDYFNLANSDQEVTSPFERLSCISHGANVIRTGTLLANETIYREENKNEYTAGLEFVGVYQRGKEISWVQVGNPQLFLLRSGTDLVQVTGSLNATIDFSKGELLPPLPNQMLGLDRSCNMIVNQFVVRSNDILLFIHSSIIPKELFTLKHSKEPIPEVTKILSKRNPNQPFWIGALSF